MADGANPSDSDDDGPSSLTTAIIASVCVLILVVMGVAYFGDGTYRVAPMSFNSRFGTVILDSEGLSLIRARKLSWEGRDQIRSYVEKLRVSSSQMRSLSVTRSRLEHLFILSAEDGWTDFQFVINPAQNLCSVEAIRNRFIELTPSPLLDRPLPGDPGVWILEYRVALSVEETVDLIETLIEDDCGNIEKDEITIYYIY